MAARQEKLDQLRAAILADPLGYKKKWVEAAGLGRNFWNVNKEECDAVYNECCKEQFAGLGQKALNAAKVILDDPERKDYNSMAQFILSHTEWIEPEKKEILTNNITITVDDD